MRNALPLIRVADIIDEWDGGTITLSDGTTGGTDAFGKRATWADCSGPLVQLAPSRRPTAIAMLDHPSKPEPPERLVRALVRAARHQSAVLRWPADAPARRNVVAATPHRDP